MRAGQMRDRITIQKFFPSTDPRYGEAGDWMPVATVWASVKAISGTEIVNGQAVQTQITHKLRLRYLANVTAKHQVIYQGRILDVSAAFDPDGTRAELWMDCIEHLAEQN